MVVDPERLLTLRESADRLRVSHYTVRRWIRTGLLPAVAVGPRGQYRLRPSDVDAMKTRT